MDSPPPPPPEIHTTQQTTLTAAAAAPPPSFLSSPGPRGQRWPALRSVLLSSRMARIDACGLSYSTMPQPLNK